MKHKEIPDTNTQTQSSENDVTTAEINYYTFSHIAVTHFLNKHQVTTTSSCSHASFHM